MNCYIHIPFCESRCKYCRFSTFSGKKTLEKEIYLNYLLKQIDSFSFEQIFESEKDIIFTPLETIYFGGGTPTSLSNQQLFNIINTLKQKYNFSNNIEITLETTPNNITKDSILEWQRMGINRLSLGVQTLNDDSLKEIGRLNKKDLLKKLDILFSTQFKNINLDFIIGLPYVKLLEISKDLDFILGNYNPLGISLYMLEDYYDYPKTWQNLSIKEEEFLGEYLLSSEIINKYGLERYELSNFSKKGFECAHNIGYWNHSETIAFGLGSHGFLNLHRFAYSKDFKNYYNNEFDYIEKLTNYDLELEKLMFGLRTSGVLKYTYEKFNQEKILNFIKLGLLEIKNEKLSLKDSGIVLLDYILKEII